MSTANSPDTTTADHQEQCITLKPTTLFAICIVILCAVALAYVGGVMSGRSSAEEDYYREMAALASAQEEAARSETLEEGGILPPEELEFSRVLRNSNELPSKKSMKPVPPPEAPKPQKPKEPAPEDNTVLHTNPDTGVYDYVYQVAAVKGDDNADALRQRLEGRGLRTYKKASGNYLVIHVKLRGSTSRSDELLTILEQLRLGRPILVSKKPAKN